MRFTDPELEKVLRLSIVFLLGPAGASAYHTSLSINSKLYKKNVLDKSTRTSRLMSRVTLPLLLPSRNFSLLVLCSTSGPEGSNCCLGMHKVKLFSLCHLFVWFGQDLRLHQFKASHRLNFAKYHITRSVKITSQGKI